MSATRSDRRRRLSDLVLCAGLIVAFAELLGLLAVPLSLRLPGYCFAVATLFRYQALRLAEH